MNRRQFVTGLVLWLGLLALLLKWTSNPLMWAWQLPPRKGDSMTSAMQQLEQVRKQFPVHLASFLPSAMQQHADQIMDDDPDSRAPFHALDWASRETGRRGLVSFLFVMASGWLIHWFISRILDGRKDYTE